MTALELDEELSGLELLSPELKEKAGYNKEIVLWFLKEEKEDRFLGRKARKEILDNFKAYGIELPE